jgi:serine/threonine protein phosphatase PrpC
MSIIKTIPSQRLINGKVVNTSEVSVVTNEDFYITNAEDCIIVRGDKSTTVKLQSTTTDHVVVKALTHLIILPDLGKIDEEFDEITCDRGACIEFRFCNGNWYILSSDGLKQS